MKIQMQAQGKIIILFFILLLCGNLIFPDIIRSQMKTKMRNPFIPELPKETPKIEVTVSEPGPLPPVYEPPPRPPEPDVPEPEPPQEIQPPQVDIRGLVWNTNRPQAIINDQVVDVGDMIDDAKIVAIRKNEVDVVYQGASFTLKYY